MSQLPYSISFGKGVHTNTLEISGNLVINHIEKIYKEIAEKIDFSRNLNITIQSVENIDITFVQLVLALKKEYSEKQLSLEVVIDLPEDLWTLLKNAGIKTKFN